MNKILFVLLSLLLAFPGIAQEKWLTVLDMVHHNPGEPLTQTSFRDEAKLASYGYDAMVVNEFKFPQCAVSFDRFDKRIFPKGSPERKWVMDLRKQIREQIERCHAQGLECLYFTDVIVLPKRLIELYEKEICDETGAISFEKPLTWKIHELMFEELFTLFPDLDGLVIRTGETYTHNIPYHRGNNPVNYSRKYAQSKAIHAGLIGLLRKIACEKYGKKIIYRTWDFGNFHTNPDYYLEVTGKIEPHENLFFSIKHTNGDYFRTYPFNRTLGIGHHRQIVEVQCQREFEGKGAFPNYVANAVINGFEETKRDSGYRCLNDLLATPQFAGVWTWSRGGGWRGPYLKNELWCDLNAYVVSRWVQDPSRSEEEIFDEYADRIGILPETKGYFRRLALLSPDAVIRGRGSLIIEPNVIWTRDELLGGLDALEKNYRKIVDADLVEEVLYEMKTSVAIWQEIVELASRVKCRDQRTESFIRYSARYGLLLHGIMEQGWNVMLRGYLYERTGQLDRAAFRLALEKYDRLWTEYKNLKSDYGDDSSLYVDRYPGKWVWNRDQERIMGMGVSVDKYRQLIQ